MISDEQKEQIIEFIREKPVISYVAKKVGVSRSTIYRLLGNDETFNEKFLQAEQEGKSHVNDAAKSMLMKKINDGDIGAVKYWLGNNDPTFMNKERFERSKQEEKNIYGNYISGIMRWLKTWRKENGNKSYSEEDIKDPIDPNDSNKPPQDPQTSA